MAPPIKGSPRSLLPAALHKPTAGARASLGYTGSACWGPRGSHGALPWHQCFLATRPSGCRGRAGLATPDTHTRAPWGKRDMCAGLATVAALRHSASPQHRAEAASHMPARHYAAAWGQPDAQRDRGPESRSRRAPGTVGPPCIRQVEGGHGLREPSLLEVTGPPWGCATSPPCSRPHAVEASAAGMRVSFAAQESLQLSTAQRVGVAVRLSQSLIGTAFHVDFIKSSGHFKGQGEHQWRREGAECPTRDHRGPETPSQLGSRAALGGLGLGPAGRRRPRAPRPALGAGSAPGHEPPPALLPDARRGALRRRTCPTLECPAAVSSVQGPGMTPALGFSGAAAQPSASLGHACADGGSLARPAPPCARASSPPHGGRDDSAPVTEKPESPPRGHGRAPSSPRLVPVRVEGPRPPCTSRGTERGSLRDELGAAPRGAAAALALAGR